LPELSRRNALKLGVGVVGFAAVAGPAGALGLAAGTGTTRPAIPVRSHFTPSIGATFVAAGSSGMHRLTLVQILDVAPVTKQNDEDRFNLIFEASGETIPGQGIYTFTRTGVPATQLFISPIGPASGPVRLQGLVNRSV